jgi:Phage integrase, N-terminal SAM-like domain
MRVAIMPFLQLYKGSYRVRRPIPKHLQPFVNRGARLTHTLRVKGELPLRDRAEANRRAAPIFAAFQAMIDKAQGNHDILYGPLEQTRVEQPVHTYRLRDPADPTSIEIVSTVMVERFVKKTEVVKAALPIVAAVAETVAVVSFESMIAAWASEKQKSKTARSDYTTKIARFIRFLGHEDMTRVTLPECRRYKDELLAEMREAGKADLTVKNYLAAIRVVFAYAVDNGIGGIESNPMNGVKFQPGKGMERRAFTTAERQTILSLARQQEPVSSAVGSPKWPMHILPISNASKGFGLFISARIIGRKINPSKPMHQPAWCRCIPL